MMTKFMLIAGAAVFLLGSSAFETSAFAAQCGVTPSAPCHPNNGGGNGGHDGSPNDRSDTYR